MSNKKTPSGGVFPCSNGAEHEKTPKGVSSCSGRVRDGNEHNKTPTKGVLLCSKGAR